jgi:hypothetical protein
MERTQTGVAVAADEASRGEPFDRADDDQIAERLRWTPKQRLDYLLDMLAFEERARRATATRCCSPPDSSAGKRWRAAGSTPTCGGGRGT